MSDQAPPPKNAVNVLEMWPQAAAIVTGATVVLSILYNWAYFQVAYPSGMQLLTITDHVASALVWLPQGTLVYFFLGFVQATLVKQPKKRPDPPRSIIIGTRFFLVGVVSVMYLFAQPLVWSGVASVVAIVCIVRVLNMIRYTRLTGHAAVFLLSALALCSLALSEGNRTALADFTATTGNVTVMLREGPPIDGILVLRQLDRGVLMRRVKEGNVTFIPWEDIKELAVPEATIDRRWRICIMFGVFCGEHRVTF